jgi:hypothetical protein
MSITIILYAVFYSFFKHTLPEPGNIPAQLGPLERVSLDSWTLKEVLSRAFSLLMTKEIRTETF